MSTESTNFAFLQEHDPIFLQLAVSAERTFRTDPNTTLIKLRQFGEALAQDLAAKVGLRCGPETNQADLLYSLSRELDFEPEIRQMFHTLRIEGNKATHSFRSEHREALAALQVARSLAVWYHSAFGKRGSAFKAGPFMAPIDPMAQLDELKAEIVHVRAQADESHQLNHLLEQEKQQAAAIESQLRNEAALLEQMLVEQEGRTQAIQNEFAERLQQAHSVEPAQVLARTRKAFQHLDINEDLTRILVDEQLRLAGWDADTHELTYANGVRPQKGRNIAIAEWPTQGKQAADYILFAGLKPIATVEAKRQNIDVAGKIPQAERYSEGFRLLKDMQAAWNHSGPYHIPFVYSCNGRPYQTQLAEKSGVWFRDVRQPSNLARPLPEFHSPAGLLDLLERDQKAAEARLRAEGFAYLSLWDFQERAVVAVEKALESNQRACLVAMATGTGKTRTILGLIYRLLKAERFKRILFLVDRTALGTQALDTFAATTLEQSQPLSKIYNVAELGDMAAAAETRVQVATVQAMVKRIFASDAPPCIDDYDCVIVDEAHRGYTLDQEMTDSELEYRDASQYLSTYRRVLDYFDAVKIGLTATPAKHTTEIFGKPVFVYTYREAVADGWLIDHEPPIRYETLLTQNGIQFAKGERVSVVNTRNGGIDTAELEDEMKFDVEHFNRRVITEEFNRVICEQLAQEIDPNGDEKTLVFCATDTHADMVKRLLDSAFANVYGDLYNEAAVKKITGATDRVETAIKRFKNERFPSIAITVDLLTTGIDVKPICHLVFLRRVKSRILYEQMKGRATRRCTEIGKTVFKIYDPVDLTASLEAVDTMKPLVKDPKVALGQLVNELQSPDISAHGDEVLQQIVQKIMRVLIKASHKSATRPELKSKLMELEQSWGVDPAQLHEHLRKLGSAGTRSFIQQHSRLVEQIDEVSFILGSHNYPIISTRVDFLKERSQNFGTSGGFDDYLREFHDFVCNSVNQNIALAVVVNRPKDLTREQLKEVRLLLDQQGYSEAKLRAAWRSKTNEEIAAGIVGYIRQAALGEALLPFEHRVEKGLRKILAMRPWNPVQRKWLERLAKQIKFETVLDAGFVNENFRSDGGAKGLERVLGGPLDTILHDLTESIWTAA